MPHLLVVDSHGVPVRTRATRYPILGYRQAARCGKAVEKSIYSAEYQRLCALLRALRLEAGMTQVQVAAELDVPQSFVSKYESGERRLDVIELRYVARTLGVSMRVVLERLEQ
ncbi:helix-turn-helix domain-containing protein [Streptomyces sp. NPDC048504]|uniref:helix-turn-helix domain-containing protein n=1 Tax=Streptomyces sp. NPDC048504 TaxID=3365559 RepID=UPI0037157702